LEFSNAR